MAQKQKETGIITLSAVPIRICCPLLCLFLKNTCCPFAIALAQVSFIELKLGQTNSSMLFVFLSLKCQFV